MAPTDWVSWHERYRDADDPLSRRLALVQGLIAEVLDSREGREVHALSLCAGDGRDVLGVLSARGGRDQVTGRLVELDSELADAATAAIAHDGVLGLHVLNGDAGVTDSYAGAVPADLVLACGIFGNVADLDVERTIAGMPMLCAEGARVIWTRHRREPDLTGQIREWFEATGFAEVAFETDGQDPFAVGMHRFTGAPKPLEMGRRLFTFQR